MGPALMIFICSFTTLFSSQKMLRRLAVSRLGDLLLPAGPRTTTTARTLTVQAGSGRSARGIRIARPEEEDLRHYCSSPIPNAASMHFLREAGTERFALKPRGLWLSERDEWRRWSCKEDVRVDKTAGYHPVVLKPEARLLCCTSDEELAAVEDQFLMGQPPGSTTSPSIAYIRWEAMHSHAQGMYLSHEMATVHHKYVSFDAAYSSRFGYMVNAWDVGSVVLWDPKAAIASIGDWVESPPCPRWSELEDPASTC